MNVRPERNGWRDESISRRHRIWGWNCPAVDLDFVMCEYNHGKPCALVEYKHANAGTINVTHPTYRAIAALADGYSPGALPAFVAIYDSDTWAFKIITLNDAARKHFGHREGMILTEQEFVRDLYVMRKLVLTNRDMEVIGTLNHDRNWNIKFLQVEHD